MRTRRTGSKVLVLSAALAAGLTWTGAAAADKEKVRLTKAGQAAARAVVLRRADLGAATGWSGGAKKPDLSQSMDCAAYEPKQSDLVLVGAAQSVWKHTGLELESEAQVLQTPGMVRLDWQRSVLAPQVLPCMRSAVAKGLRPSQRLVSVQRVSFPRVATYTRAYRALVDVPAATGTVRVLVDMVLVGRGRTEVTLTATAPFVAAPVVRSAEVRLAQLLAGRITA